MSTTLEPGDLLVDCGDGTFEHLAMSWRRRSREISRHAGTLELERVSALGRGLLGGAQVPYSGLVTRGLVLL